MGVGAINGGRGSKWGGHSIVGMNTVQLYVKVPGSRTYGEGGKKWGGQ